MDQETFKILFYPNENLRQRNFHDVVWVEASHIKDAEKMLRTMKKGRGVGLAAPQVGLPYNLIVMDHDGQSPRILFNPYILERSTKSVPLAEGCLSFPKLTKILKRNDSVVVRYRDVNNEIKLESFEGFEARIVQHEIDHLHGILLIDK